MKTKTLSYNCHEIPRAKIITSWQIEKKSLKEKRKKITAKRKSLRQKEKKPMAKRNLLWTKKIHGEKNKTSRKNEIAHIEKKKPHGEVFAPKYFLSPLGISICCDMGHRKMCNCLVEMKRFDLVNQYHFIQSPLEWNLAWEVRNCRV